MKTHWILSAALAFSLPALAQDAPGHEGHNHGAAAPGEESSVDYFWRKSDEAFHAGDYPRAIGCHKAIMALDPTLVESYSLAAWLSWSLDKPAEAVAFIERGLKANPQSVEMWDAAGQHFDLQKRFVDAQKSYGKAVELAGANSDQMLRRRLAHAHEHAGDLGSSAATWRGLVADFPADVVTKNNLARVEKTRAEQKPVVPVAALVATLGLGLVMSSRWKGNKSSV